MTTIVGFVKSLSWMGENRRVQVKTASEKKDLDVPAVFFVNFDLEVDDEVRVLVESSGKIVWIENWTKETVKNPKGEK